MAKALPTILLILAALLAPSLQPQTTQPGHPNIVFILADDQAPWALGLSGHPYASTPNLDRLFQEGAYLVNSFTTTPVCSPSRASLMTGRYGSEIGITEWINPRREPELGLDPKLVTWPEVLEQGGYRTGLVGKWHLGLADKFHPTKTGFDYFMGFRGGGTTPSDPELEENGKYRKFEGFTTDILTDRALGFLERNKGRTFHLSIHFRAPHAPWLPVRDEDWAPFDGIDPKVPNPDYPKLDIPRVKKMTREYLASVRGVDRNVGRVLKRLDELGLSGKTIVIYSSDHGYNMGHNGIWHKGNGHWVLTENPKATYNIPDGQRPNMYDNSIRVPTAVRWPGVVKPGTTITQTVANIDWYRTIVEMAGLRVPAGVTIRGRSIVPLLKGERLAWENDFYAEYSTRHQSYTHMRMYRTAEWKLIRDFLDPSRDELYNLKSDPAETKNLIGAGTPETKRVIGELHAKIVARMQEIGDPVVRLANGPLPGQ
jgi:arylsulfatase A-like enzyme